MSDQVEKQNVGFLMTRLNSYTIRRKSEATVDKSKSIVPFIVVYTNGTTICYSVEERWPSSRASDSGARGRGFDLHSGRRVVSLSKIQ